MKTAKELREAARIRQQALRDRRTAAGLVPVHFTTTPEVAEKLRRFFAKLTLTR